MPTPIRKSTIRDVAEHAGVSIKTVSRVLNNEPRVRAATEEKVRAAATALGFTVNAAARQLAGGRAHSIAVVIVARTQWQWTAELIAGALGRSQTRGYGLVPYVLESYEERERAIVLMLATQRAVDGIILTTPWSERPDMHADIAASGLPFVLLPAPPGTGRFGVRADEEGGAYAMARHLLELGHRRIAVVAGQRELDLTIQRRAGFGRAMHEAGVAIDPACEFYTNYTARAGHRAMTALIDAGRLPTAVFAFSDVLAAGVLRAAHERGIAVPEQLSVAGAGDQVVAGLVWPALTTVAVPSEAMAARAVDLLIDQIEGTGDGAREVVFGTRLVARASTGPAAATS